MQTSRYVLAQTAQDVHRIGGLNGINYRREMRTRRRRDVELFAEEEYLGAELIDMVQQQGRLSRKIDSESQRVRDECAREMRGCAYWYEEELGVCNAERNSREDEEKKLDPNDPNFRENREQIITDAWGLWSRRIH